MKLSHLMYNPIDDLSKEQDALVKAREMREVEILKNFADDAGPQKVAPVIEGDSSLAIKETLDKMQAKINSAQRKMENFKCNASKRAQGTSVFEDERNSVPPKQSGNLGADSTAAMTSKGN